MAPGYIKLIERVCNLSCRDPYGIHGSVMAVKELNDSVRILAHECIENNVIGDAFVENPADAIKWLSSETFGNIAYDNTLGGWLSSLECVIEYRNLEATPLYAKANESDRQIIASYWNDTRRLVCMVVSHIKYQVDMYYTSQSLKKNNGSDIIPNNMGKTAKQKSKRGRKRRAFIDFIPSTYKDNADDIIKALHLLLDGSRGSDAALTLYSIINAGYIRDNVERTAFEREFPKCSIDNNTWTSHVKGSQFFSGYNGRIAEKKEKFMQLLNLNNIE